MAQPQLQDLLDEWLVHYHHRPHEGLRHPTLPKKALTPNQMWAALIAVAGCYCGISAPEGAEGIGIAATRGVVWATLLVLLSNVLLVKVIQLVT